MPLNHTTTLTQTARTICSALMAVAAIACNQPQSPPPERGPAAPAGTDQLKPSYDDTGKLQKLAYDRDHDGKVDTWGYMDGTRVVRVEVDENGDGAIDRWEFHRADDGSAGSSAAAPVSVDRSIERIERATRFDGKVSRREFFDNGALTRVEEDTDGNGTIDKWETYAGGSLSMMALDTRGRGTPDRRLLYKTDGSFDHIEADPDGTGAFTPVTP